MKKGLIAGFCGICYTLVIGLLCYQLGTMNPREDSNFGEFTVQAEAIAAPEISPTPVVTSYTVKEYNNRIGVYENDELIRIVSIPISEMRAQDAEKLKQGIVLQTKEEVAEILEDYSS